jgi:hypothetical protein
MRVDHIRYTAFAAPVRRSATGKAIHGIDMYDIELRHSIAKSAPHSRTIHIPARPTQSSEIMNLDAVIVDRAIERNFQMAAPIHIAGVNRNLVPLSRQLPGELWASN